MVQKFNSKLEIIFLKNLPLEAVKIRNYQSPLPDFCGINVYFW